MNDIATTITGQHASPGAVDRFLRQQLLTRMRGLRHGRLVLQDAFGAVELGEPASAHPQLQVHLQVLDADFYRAVARHGSVGAGESYMDGQWRCDNLVGLIRCWFATATCSTAWKADWPGSAAWRCEAGMRCAAIRVTAAGAISRRITISATTSSACSCRRT